MHEFTNTECSTHGHHCCSLKHLSWTAILVGALVAVGLGFLLNLFGVAIGLSFVKSTPTGAVSLAVGGFIALLLGVIVTMYVAGFTSGYLGRTTDCEKAGWGILYGFTTWCVALILTALLTMPMGRYVVAYTTLVTNATGVELTEHQRIASDGVSGSALDNDVSPGEAKAANRLGAAAFMIFVLFFVGAISCGFGGHCGMCSKCHKKE